MLHIFVNPLQIPTDDERLTTLNEFITYINKTNLPETTREDATKVLESLRWIKVNLEQINTFITQKDLYISELPPADQANGVIRDHMGTALHFNAYASGEAAVRDIFGIVIAFEQVFTRFNASDNTLALYTFIAKCNHDRDHGCLELRTSNALLFAGAIEATGGVLPLDDLLQVPQLLYFLSLEEDRYNFVMADHFFSAYYGQLVIVDAEQTPLTRELLFDRMVINFGYTSPTITELEAEKALKTTNPTT